jgi:selenocysteine lyase/cysteine desulfurase
MERTVALDTNQIEALQAKMAYDTADLQMAEANFGIQYPDYAKTRSLDDVRKKDYARLDELGHVYLDYTGGGLYAVSQLNQHMAMLLNGVYGNPHSANPTSLASTEATETARSYIHRYFNADPVEYAVIFTANASAALKIVGESYPFEENGQYLLTFDNHNSVNGIREFARSKAAPVIYSPMTVPDLRINAAELRANLDKAIVGGNNLFSFPAQSNFSGVQHSLKWIQIAHDKGWDVLLDSAAFAPTNRLDIGKWQPDFVPLSFYKIFGYPTGVGALIARRSLLKKLRRPWFAGGTITVATVQGDKHYLEEGSAAFEDGTIDYLNLPAIKIGLKHIESTDLDTIHERVMALTAYLLDELNTIRHENDAPLLTIYGPITTEERGGTISLNLYDADGTIFDYRLVEALANKVNISIRTGCFCNPGAGELAMGIEGEELQQALANEERVTFEQLVIAMTANGEHDAVGAIRISVGLATNFHDVFHLVQFLKSFLNVKSKGLLFGGAGEC